MGGFLKLRPIHGSRKSATHGTFVPRATSAAARWTLSGGEVIAPGAAAALEGALAARLARWRTGGRAPDAVPSWLGAHTREHLASQLATALDGVVAGARA